jgi:DNA-binding NtrC family response regulator
MGYRHAVLSEPERANLMAYDWPGNVRELKNILERAIILQHGSELRPSLLLEAARGDTPSASACPPLAGDDMTTLAEMEKRHIRLTLDKLTGNLTQTARALDISLSTLKRKIKEYGLK